MAESDRLIKEFESFSKAGTDTYDLLLGTEIKFLPDMPAYKVTELMRKVQGHEEATVNTPLSERERGGMTEESQRGYRNWLHAYKLLYKEDLSGRDMVALDKAMAAMNVMEQDRIVLRDIESYASFPKDLPDKPAKMVAVLSKANYNADMQKVLDRQLAPLRKIPPEPTVLVSGFRGHHTVTKIEKDKLGYKVTTYNAGAEAKDAGDGENVMAKYSQHLNRGVNVEDYIRLINERKIRGMFAGEDYKISKALESCVGKVEEFTPTPPQHKGNCTTRSTREMLRDMLEPERFTHMHRHVSNPDVCDPADIMAALQMRRDALAVAVPVEKPKDQHDWVQSVSEIHLSRSKSSHDGFSEMVQQTPARKGSFSKI